MANFRNTTSGTISANGASVGLEYRHFSNGAVGVQVTGTFTGTLEFQLTLDGSTYVAAETLNVSNTNTPVTTCTAPGVFRFETVGAKLVRVKATAWTSGDAVVTLVAMDG